MIMSNKTYLKLNYGKKENSKYDPKDRADEYAEEMGYSRNRDVFNDRKKGILWISFKRYIPNISGVDVITIENTTRKEFLEKKKELIE